MRIQRLESGAFIASHHGINVHFNDVMTLGTEDNCVCKLLHGLKVSAVLGGQAAKAFHAEFERLKLIDAVGVN